MEPTRALADDDSHARAATAVGGVATEAGRARAFVRAIRPTTASLRRAGEELRRAVLLPLIVALVPLAWVADGTERASLTTLGRDQGIFQYIAWALSRGEVDYRDVRDVNGPLTHLIHWVFLRFGGADEHRFRVLDLTVTGAVFALAGACLPGIASRRRVHLLERLAWAFAAYVVLEGQLLGYLYWDLAQRETFFNWFLVTSVSLLLVAQRRLATTSSATSLGARSLTTALVTLAGAASVVPWFGKPTYAAFTIAQIATLVVDGDMTRPARRRALLHFFGGAVLGAASQLAFLVATGDARAFLRIYLVDVPTMYRFMLPRSAAEILSLQWGGATAASAFATSLVFFGLIWDRQLPRRLLAVALLPLVGLASVLAQRKGFPYHFHPVTLGMHLQWLVLVVWLWERFRGVGARSDGGAEAGPYRFLRFVPFVAAAALTLKVALSLTTSPHITNVWILGKAQSKEERESHDYLVYFRDHDFFPWEMRQAAAYVKRNTRDGDRVQIYGMDPYLLFLAERRSATPYIYAYDLNADAALGGSWMPNGLRPNGFEADRIRALRAEHVRDFTERVRRTPPAAFVLIDKSPLISNESAWVDFRDQCPDAAALVEAEYEETAAFGEFHVHLRRDLAREAVGVD